MIWLYMKLHVTISKKYFIKMLSTVLFLEKKILKSIKKSSPVMLIWFHKIPFYHLNKRILWKQYLLYTDYLISQRYKKCSPGKYPLLLYLAVSIRWISVRFDAVLTYIRDVQTHIRGVLTYTRSVLTGQQHFA